MAKKQKKRNPFWLVFVVTFFILTSIFMIGSFYEIFLDENTSHNFDKAIYGVFKGEAAHKTIALILYFGWFTMMIECLKYFRDLIKQYLIK